jgi:hypothetical protein
METFHEFSCFFSHVFITSNLKDVFNWNFFIEILCVSKWVDDFADDLNLSHLVDTHRILYRYVFWCYCFEVYAHFCVCCYCSIYLHSNFCIRCCLLLQHNYV